MHKLIFRQATQADIEHVAVHLRPEHVREVEGMTGLPAARAVKLSVVDSTSVFAGIVGEEVVLLAGVTRRPLLSGRGCVWMVATPAIDRHPLEAAAALCDLFSKAHALADASVLEQWLPLWYRKGIKWLLWLGWRRAEEKDICGVRHVRMVHTEKEAE